MSILSLSSTLGTLSHRETPHTHSIVLISVHSNGTIWSAFTPQVLFPYSIALLTHVTYTFPFNFNDISFLVKITDGSLNFPHAQGILTNGAESTLPPPLSLSPREQNSFQLCLHSRFHGSMLSCLSISSPSPFFVYKIFILETNISFVLWMLQAEEKNT